MCVRGDKRKASGPPSRGLVPRDGAAPVRAAGGRPDARGRPIRGRPARCTRPSRPPRGRPVRGRPARVHGVPSRPVHGVQGRPVHGRPVRGRPVHGRPVRDRPARGRPVRHAAAHSAAVPHVAVPSAAVTSAVSSVARAGRHAKQKHFDLTLIDLDKRRQIPFVVREARPPAIRDVEPKVNKIRRPLGVKRRRHGLGCDAGEWFRKKSCANFWWPPQPVGHVGTSTTSARRAKDRRTEARVRTMFS